MDNVLLWVLPCHNNIILSSKIACFYKEAILESPLHLQMNQNGASFY
jgi:hypothetical protein